MTVTKTLCVTCGRPLEWDHHEGCAPPVAPAAAPWSEEWMAFGQVVVIGLVLLMGAAVLVGILLALNQLPGALHHYERQQECMKWQPPTETMAEWFRQRRACREATK